MNIRSTPPLRRQPIMNKPSKKPALHVLHIAGLLIVSIALIWMSADVASLVNRNYTAPISELRSGKAGYCLDDYHNQKPPHAIADAWLCNGSPAQNWLLNSDYIKQPDGNCLTVNAKSEVIVQRCNQQQNQQWRKDGGGWRNASNHQCLSLPVGKTGRQLITVPCGSVTNIDLAWSLGIWHGSLLSISSPVCHQARLGERVACYANRQWLAWETEPSLHVALLNAYTDGNSYEEWCADFVSYVYREAGVPFTNGERNGWDEYNANYIQYMGFTKHYASSGYVPKAGDIAYFNYTGGHVEIVVSGGRHPVFIYGDSGTVDPLTHNGTMVRNRLTSDGTAGSVQYYLSPN